MVSCERLKLRLTIKSQFSQLHQAKSHPALGDFERAAFLEVRGDAGGAKKSPIFLSMPASGPLAVE
jgi:hypothetical protein